MVVCVSVCVSMCVCVCVWRDKDVIDMAVIKGRRQDRGS